VACPGLCLTLFGSALVLLGILEDHSWFGSAQGWRRQGFGLDGFGNYGVPDWAVKFASGTGNGPISSYSFEASDSRYQGQSKDLRIKKCFLCATVI
jgi:hypothetical protein